jgi:hypothetical protein
MDIGLRQWSRQDSSRLVMMQETVEDQGSHNALLRILTQRNPKQTERMLKES